MKQFPHEHPRPPKPPYGRFNDCPLVHETSRTVDIRDYFGMLRYKVSIDDLTDANNDYMDNHEDLRYNGKCFQVQVISYVYGNTPTIIINELFDDFGMADHFYHENIKFYTQLTKAETRDYQDIDIYAEKIGYRVIDPNRCGNCIFAKKVPCGHTKPMPHLGHHHPHKPIFRCFCTNDKIFGIQDPENPEHVCRPNIPIHPEVSEIGICDHYVRKEPPCRR